MTDAIIYIQKKKFKPQITQRWNLNHMPIPPATTSDPNIGLLI